MSNEQNPKNVKNDPTEEPKPTDELANEALDQVVGGAGSAPTLPPVSKHKRAPGGRKVQRPGPEEPHLPEVHVPDTEWS